MRNTIDSMDGSLILNQRHFDGSYFLQYIQIPCTQVLKLRNFVQSLTESMHQRIPNSLVIWYDSIISTGEVRWQNELNQHNQMFHEVCDGFFLSEFITFCLIAKTIVGIKITSKIRLLLLQPSTLTCFLLVTYLAVGHLVADSLIHIK